MWGTLHPASPFPNLSSASSECTQFLSPSCFFTAAPKWGRGVNLHHTSPNLNSSCFASVGFFLPQSPVMWGLNGARAHREASRQTWCPGLLLDHQQAPSQHLACPSLRNMFWGTYLLRWDRKGHQETQKETGSWGHMVGVSPPSATPLCSSGLFLTRWLQILQKSPFSKP